MSRCIDCECVRRKESNSGRCCECEKIDIAVKEEMQRRKSKILFLVQRETKIQRSVRAAFDRAFKKLAASA